MKMNVICIIHLAWLLQVWIERRYLHAILQFCNKWICRYEGEKLPLPCEGHGDDQCHEEYHLEDKEKEDLLIESLVSLI